MKFEKETMAVHPVKPDLDSDASASAGAPEESGGPETVKPPADTAVEPPADTTAEPSAAISAVTPESEVTDNKTALTAADEVLSLIEALPYPEDVTTENAEEVEAQLKELLYLYQTLDGDEQEEISEASSGRLS